jgi:SAM-dependent methyltransferase
MAAEAPQTAATPSAALLRQQAEWLAPARARLLRRAGIAHRRSVLDLGAGSGAVTPELARRSDGRVVALDQAWAPLRAAAAPGICAQAGRLPFPAAAFDLVFCQCALLWMNPLPTVISEIWRVLQPGGLLLALEPDYGGLLEYPPTVALRDIWLAALARAGAEPLVGRALPTLLARQGFEVRADLLPELLPPSPARFDLLRGLPLTRREQRALRRAERAAATLNDSWQQIAHLPFVLLSASR